MKWTIQRGNLKRGNLWNLFKEAIIKGVDEVKISLLLVYSLVYIYILLRMIYYVWLIWPILFDFKMIELLK